MGSLEGKKQIVAELVEKFKQAPAVVVVDYRGVNVAQITKLRKDLREAGIEYVVVKNTLLTIAAKEAGVEGLASTFKGVTAIAFASDDVVAPAKIIGKFIKDNKVMEVKGGLLEGEVIDAAAVTALGELPSKEVLLAQVASCFQAPIQRMAYVLEEIRKSKEGQETA